MIGGVSAEVRLRIDSMQAMVTQYVHATLTPEIEQAVKRAVAGFDLDKAVQRAVTCEYERMMNAAIARLVQDFLWKEQKRVERIVRNAVAQGEYPR